MKAVTSSQMKELDRLTIESYGIPSLLLMENAGRGVAEMIFDISRPGRVTVFCGKGNNGGDGFVTARHLHNRGFQVFVVLAGDPGSLKSDPAVNFFILQKMKIPFMAVNEETAREAMVSVIQKTDVVIDAVFGVGLERPVEGVYRTVIESINEGARTVVAVDVPSGLHSDTGEILGCAVRATHTATLALPKKGLFCGQGPEMSGKIGVIEIGIPRQELEKLCRA